MKAFGAVLAIAVALALQTTLDRFLGGTEAAVDLVLVAVVYAALTNGPVGGMFAGTLAGLIQDALTSGMLGIGGLAKSTVGFLVGAVSQQFIVTAALPRLLMFAAATVVHSAVFMGLYVALNLRTFDAPVRTVAAQALANGLVGMVAFAVIEWVPLAIDRRRLNKRGRR